MILSPRLPWDHTRAQRLTFDPVPHTYALDGKPLPGVTSVLGGALIYAGVPQHVLDFAADRGRAVHLAVELELAGTLDPDSVDDRVMPYLVQFRRFMAETGYQPGGCELAVYSERHRYAGTLDNMGWLPDAEPRGVIDLLDLKATAELSPTVGAQTDAYCRAYAEMVGIPWDRIRRWCLHLKPDRYKLVPLTGASDWSVFLASLTIRNFCHVHQLFR